MLLLNIPTPENCQACPLNQKCSFCDLTITNQRSMNCPMIEIEGTLENTFIQTISLDIPKDYKYDTETTDAVIYRHKYTGDEIQVSKHPMKLTPISVATGSWKPVNPDCRGYTEQFECTNCGRIINTSYSMKRFDDYDHCPFCLAAMNSESTLDDIVPDIYIQDFCKRVEMKESGKCKTCKNCNTVHSAIADAPTETCTKSFKEPCEYEERPSEEK